MNHTWAIAVGLVLGATACLGEDTDGPASFPFCKDVQRDESRQEEILAVTLDSDVYAAVQERFADLRVVDAAGDDAHSGSPVSLSKA